MCVYVCHSWTWALPNVFLLQLMPPFILSSVATAAGESGCRWSEQSTSASLIGTTHASGSQNSISLTYNTSAPKFCCWHLHAPSSHFHEYPWGEDKLPLSESAFLLTLKKQRRIFTLCQWREYFFLCYRGRESSTHVPAKLFIGHTVW